MASNNDNKTVDEALTQAVSKLSDILATAADGGGQRKYLDYEGLTEFLGNITGAGLTASLSDTDTVMLERNGKMHRCLYSNLSKDIFPTDIRNRIYDGIRIAYHTTSKMMLATVSEWESLQDDGNVADGVAIMLHGRMLIVSPTEGGNCDYATASGVIDKTFSGRAAAAADTDGEGHMQKAIEQGLTSDTSVALGKAAAYERVNDSGLGILAGQWWIPSLGEWFTILANYYRVQYALSLISDGRQILTNTIYWTSTESSTSSCYRFGMNSDGFGNIATQSKTGSGLSLRLVSTYQD